MEVRWSGMPSFPLSNAKGKVLDRPAHTPAKHSVNTDMNTDEDQLPPHTYLECSPAPGDLSGFDPLFTLLACQVIHPAMAERKSFHVVLVYVPIAADATPTLAD